MGLKQLILGIPAGYRLLGKLIGGNSRVTYVREYLRPQAGARVLDLGCGPADVLAFLPEVDYLGVDLDSNYITAARERYGGRGEFRCEPAEAVAELEPGSFDLVMANGLIHHLTDDQAVGVFRVARRALKPGGRFVTVDGCFVPGQSWIARRLIKMDRGQFVRTEAGYLRIARQEFPDVAVSVRHDLMRVPYTHIIMTCTRPTAA
jgi:SAM-dependent methyltransferase